MSVLSKIKSIAKTINEEEMTGYVPRSQAEMYWWNQHKIVKYTDLVPGVTDNNNVFNAANIEKGVGHRDKDNKEPTNDKPVTNDKSSKSKALKADPVQKNTYEID